MTSDCDVLVGQVVAAFGAQCRTQRVGPWCRLALPIETTAGHRIEIAVSEINPHKLLISDLGKTISELINVGVDPFGNQTRAARLTALEAEFGLTRNGSELQILTDADDLGTALIRFASALKTVADMGYMHRISTAATYRINLAIREVLEREHVPFTEGSHATVRGSLEPQIMFDFAGTINATMPFGVAVLGGTGTKRLAEVWGFRFRDMHDANQTLRRVAVYDDEAQRWSRASIRILEGTADIALPSSRVDALVTILKAA